MKVRIAIIALVLAACGMGAYALLDLATPQQREGYPSTESIRSLKIN